MGPTAKSLHHLSRSEFELEHTRSLTHPAAFWEPLAREELEWQRPFTTVLAGEGSHTQWFADGQLNITHNCLDRHVRAGRAQRVAILAVDENGHVQKTTYAQLLDRTERLARALRALGVEKGDRVVLYLPQITEQVIGMLACARIGAVHSVVFGGFAAPALALRLADATPKVILTSTWTQRRGKKIDLLETVRTARATQKHIAHTIIWEREPGEVTWQAREKNWAELEADNTEGFTLATMGSEDPLFILYTSGTTGKPKGVVHTIGGYSLAAHLTTQLSFDLQGDELFWCTADAGWVTGHTYGVYGPLSNGVTTMIVEGAPDWPSPDRWWQLIAEHRVNVFYTAPTALRLLMRYGEREPAKHDLSSLRVLGSVGEPLNPVAAEWFQTHIGKKKLPLVDTWWQIETGSHMLVTLPGLPTKNGSAGLPFFGVDAAVVDDHQHPTAAGEKGHLVIRQSWPSALRDCWNQPERFAQYWSERSPWFSTGDMAIQDREGYIQILGRSDDVLNIAGHRLGTAEVESTLVAHEAVTEAAVIAAPDELTGEHLVAYITLAEGRRADEALNESLREHVKNHLGRFAHLHTIRYAPVLPKTRSGKIMRRLLRAQERGEQLGDTSTLEDQRALEPHSDQ